MFGSCANKPHRLLLLVGALALGATSLASCSDDEPAKASANATSSTTPEEVKAPLTEVVVKLPKMLAGGAAAADAAAAGEFDTASEEYDELHEVWEEVEGTVKDTDRDLYEEIETAQGLIRTGPRARTPHGSSRVPTTRSRRSSASSPRTALIAHGPRPDRRRLAPGPVAGSSVPCCCVGLVVAVGFVGRWPGAAPRRTAPDLQRHGNAVSSTRPSTSCARCGGRSIARCGCSTQGRRTRPSARPRTGYLDCFESVEAPLDVVAGRRLPLRGRGRVRPGARPHRDEGTHRRDPRPDRRRCGA